MKKQDNTTKLANVEASLKRWQTRLTRAANKVNELDRKRRRLQAQMGPVGLTDLIGNVEKPDHPVGSKKSTSEPPVISTDDPDLVEKVAAALDIPPFLKREPVDVEKLKAKRKSKEEADKHKMPLTGRAALKHIKSDSEVRKARIRRKLREEA